MILAGAEEIFPTERHRKSKQDFDHRMVDNLGNMIVGCVKRHSLWPCLTSGGLLVALWMALRQRADGGRGVDYANTARKRSVARMAFHSEHHFEGFHLQMPSAARPLTGSQGLVDQPSSVTESVIGDRIGSPPVGDDLPSLSHMAASHEPLPVWDVKIVVYIVIVRETTAGQLTCAEMCKCTYLRTPLSVGPWVVRSCSHDSLAAYGDGHPRCPGSRWMGIVRADP